MKIERKTCEECGGKVKKGKVEFTLYGNSLGHFPAAVCTQCGEELFDEETSDQIDRIAKEKGLWGLEAQTKITKVGSSYAIILNKKLVDFMGLKLGEEVHLYPEAKDKLIIQA